MQRETAALRSNRGRPLGPGLGGFPGTRLVGNSVNTRRRGSRILLPREQEMKRLARNQPKDRRRTGITQASDTKQEYQRRRLRLRPSPDSRGLSRRLLSKWRRRVPIQSPCLSCRGLCLCRGRHMGHTYLCSYILPSKRPERNRELVLLTTPQPTTSLAKRAGAPLRAPGPLLRSLTYNSRCQHRSNRATPARVCVGVRTGAMRVFRESTF